MTFLPVVLREMSVQARRKALYRLRLGAALVALGLMAWLLLVSTTNVPAAQQGKAMFMMLAQVSFIFCLVIGVRATSDCLSEERREGTLGLLFLTGLRPHDVVLGKVAAGSLASIFALLGVVPVLALGLLLGGVELLQVGATGLVLLNTMFLSLAAGAFISAGSVNERRAMVGTVVVIGAIVFGPIVVDELAGWRGQRPVAMWATPIFSFDLAMQTGGVTAMPRAFAASVVLQHLLGWLLLLWAGIRVRQSINSAPSPRLKKARNIAANHVYGSAEQRREYRARLLDRNAFFWLAAREKVKPRYAWMILGLAAVGWASLYLTYPGMAGDLPVVLALLFLTHFVLKLWVASEVCSRMIEDRRDGALELLLSTPLSVREITQGQTLALNRIFFWPVIALVLAELLLLKLGIDAAQAGAGPRIAWYFAAGASIFLIDLWALKWVAMWQSLFSTSIERILLGTLARILALPWVIFAFIMTVMAFAAIAGGVQWQPARPNPDIFFVQIWWAVSFMVALVFGWTSRAGFRRHFRAAAAGRFDASSRAVGSVGMWLRDTTRSLPRVYKYASRLPSPIRRRPVAALSAAAILALIALVGGRQAYYSMQLNRELTRIRAEGYPTTVMELARFEAAPPPELNAAEVLRRAGEPPSIHIGVGSSDEIERWGRIVDQNGHRIAALHAVTNCTGYHFTPPPTHPFSSRMQMDPATGYANLGWAEIQVAIQNGEPGRAARTVESLLWLARLLHSRPGNSLHPLTMTASALETALGEKIFKREHLGNLRKALAAAEQPEALTRAMASTRASYLIFASNQNSAPAAGTPGMVGVAGMVRALADSDKAVMGHLEKTRSLMEYARLPVSQRYTASGASAEFAAAHPVHFPGRRHSTNHWANLFAHDAVYHAWLKVMQTALAVAEYREVHGRPPESLEKLVPAFMAEVPADPFTNGPLLYRLLPGGGKGFEIVSSGQDQVEDSPGAVIDDIRMVIAR